MALSYSQGKTGSRGRKVSNEYAEMLDGFSALSDELAQIAQTVSDKGVQAKACEAGSKVITLAASRTINNATTRRTGRLAVGVSFEPDAIEGCSYIGWVENAFYGRFFETGTKFMDPIPHIRPAYEQNKPQVARAMMGVLQKEMEV